MDWRGVRRAKLRLLAGGDRGRRVGRLRSGVRDSNSCFVLLIKVPGGWVGSGEIMR